MNTTFMYYQSSITGLFRLIFIGLMIYYGFRLIVYVIVPMWLKSFASELQKQQGDQNNIHQNTTKTGDISIHQVDNRQKKGASDNIGEYVDYEEVKK